MLHGPFDNDGYGPGVVAKSATQEIPVTAAGLPGLCNRAGGDRRHRHQGDQERPGEAEPARWQRDGKIQPGPVGGRTVARDGFRPGRGPQDALDVLAAGLETRAINRIPDAGIAGCFDPISHRRMMWFVDHRMCTAPDPSMAASGGGGGRETARGEESHPARGRRLAAGEHLPARRPRSVGRTRAATSCARRGDRGAIRRRRCRRLQTSDRCRTVPGGAVLPPGLPPPRCHTPGRTPAARLAQAEPEASNGARTERDRRAHRRLPEPRMSHPWPSVRFRVEPPRRERWAGMPRVRFGAGAPGDGRPCRDSRVGLAGGGAPNDEPCRPAHDSLEP